MRKPKTIEIILTVRVPKGWSASHTRREVANAWYGPIDAYGPRQRGAPDWWGEETRIHPHFGKARVVEPGQ